MPGLALEEIQLILSINGNYDGKIKEEDCKILIS
jgi:hypothetical protein